MIILMIRKTLRVCSVLLVAMGANLILHSANASELTIPSSFAAGTPAIAADVNANFTAVATAVNDNDARIAALEAQILALEALVADLQAASVPNLGTYLRIDETDPLRPTAIFEAVNVQVVNGSVFGTTAGPVNGLGNLIVGYDEPRSIDSDKSGSHNLIVGAEHNYSSYGGFVAGYNNTISNIHASVSGGAFNTASGDSSSVSGGSGNTASGVFSSVSGGVLNTASGVRSSVSGGDRNTASGINSSVSGGLSRVAWNEWDWSAGGLFQDQ